MYVLVADCSNGTLPVPVSKSAIDSSRLVASQGAAKKRSQWSPADCESVIQWHEHESRYLDLSLVPMTPLRTVGV